MTFDNHDTKAGITGGTHLRIQSPQGGATLSGQVKVILVTTREHRCEDVTTLWVDGQFRGHTNADQLHTWKYGVNREDFFLETCLHSNGEHMLSVTDEFGGSDARRVVFHNAISAVEIHSSLEAEPPGESQFSYFIQAVVTPPQGWRVELRTLTGLPVRRFEGEGDRIDLRWDGTDEQGQPVDDFPRGVFMRAASESNATLVGFINDLSLPVSP